MTIKNTNCFIISLLSLVYLWIVGAISVNIHIQMLRNGIPYPGNHFHPPHYIAFLKYGVQLCGMYWILNQLNNKFISIGFVIKTLILFIIMATLNELILRLPLTAGYVVDKHFLFVWVSEYLPDILSLILACFILNFIMLIKARRWLGRIFITLLIIVYTILSVKFITPFLNYGAHYLLQFINPPNPNNILHSPYNWQTDVIASVFFIEPMIACFVITWLIWDALHGNMILKSVQVILVILILNNGLALFISFMLYNDLPPLTAILSVGQLTLQWIFAGIMISIMYHHLNLIARRC